MITCDIGQDALKLPGNASDSLTNNLAGRVHITRYGAQPGIELTRQ
jgi:hypothetical protein